MRVGSSFSFEEVGLTFDDHLAFLNTLEQGAHNLTIDTSGDQYLVMDGDLEIFRGETLGMATSFLTGMYVCARYFHDDAP